jgi:hypothetical protein
MTTPMRLASGHRGKRLKLPQQWAARSYSHERIGRIEGLCRACAGPSLSQWRKIGVGEMARRQVAKATARFPALQAQFMPSTGECYACELAAGVEVIGVGANPNRLESRGGRGNRGPALAVFGFFVTVFF